MRHALGLVAAAVVLGAGAGGGSASGPPRGPVAEVRAYVAALNRHDPAAVCATFAPALRHYEGHWDSGATHPVSCRVAVAGHFTYYGDERWLNARIVRVRSISIDRRGIAAVALTLDHQYVCIPPGVSPDAPCRTRTIRRPELVYLIRVVGSWRVLKPGRVFRAAGISSPNGPDSDWYPPGDARTVSQPVRDMGARFSCPATRVTVSGHDRVDVPSGSASAPWLSIRRFAVSQLAGGRACFSLRLGAVPRPDSSYSLGVGPVAQSAPTSLYTIDFDGLGGAHVLVDDIGTIDNPSIVRELPRIALRGTELDVLAPHWARLTGTYLAAASAQSLQFTEPLLRNPLDASDDGVPYEACLVVPSGRLDRTGNCGTAPSP